MTTKVSSVRIEWATICDEVFAPTASFLAIERPIIQGTHADIGEEVDIHVAVVIVTSFDEITQGGVVRFEYSVYAPDMTVVQEGTKRYLVEQHPESLPGFDARAVVELILPVLVREHGHYTVTVGINGTPRWTMSHAFVAPPGPDER